MKEILLPNNTGIVLVDDADYEWLSKFKWQSRGSYAGRRKPYKMVKGVRPSGTIYMHREIMQCPEGMTVDHIDGNHFNNQRANLRVCSFGENQRNKKIQRTPKSSRFKGVHWVALRGNWQSKIQLNGKALHIGTFTCEIAAARAYNEVALEHFGEFARLNIIP